MGKQRFSYQSNKRHHELNEFTAQSSPPPLSDATPEGSLLYYVDSEIVFFQRGITVGAQVLKILQYALHLSCFTAAF